MSRSILTILTLSQLWASENNAPQENPTETQVTQILIKADTQVAETLTETVTGNLEENKTTETSDDLSEESVDLSEKVLKTGQEETSQDNQEETSQDNSQETSQDNQEEFSEDNTLLESTPDKKESSMISNMISSMNSASMHSHGHSCAHPDENEDEDDLIFAPRSRRQARQENTNKEELDEELKKLEISESEDRESSECLTPHSQAEGENESADKILLDESDDKILSDASKSEDDSIFSDASKSDSDPEEIENTSVEIENSEIPETPVNTPEVEKTEVEILSPVQEVSEDSGDTSDSERDTSANTSASDSIPLIPESTDEEILSSNSPQFAHSNKFTSDDVFSGEIDESQFGESLSVKSTPGQTQRLLKDGNSTKDGDITMISTDAISHPLVFPTPTDDTTATELFSDMDWSEVTRGNRRCQSAEVLLQDRSREGDISCSDEDSEGDSSDDSEHSGDKRDSFNGDISLDEFDNKQMTAQINDMYTRNRELEEKLVEEPVGESVLLVEERHVTFALPEEGGDLQEESDLLVESDLQDESVTSSNLPPLDLGASDDSISSPVDTELRISVSDDNNAVSSSNIPPFASDRLDDTVVLNEDRDSDSKSDRELDSKLDLISISGEIITDTALTKSTQVNTLIDGTITENITGGTFDGVIDSDGDEFFTPMGFSTKAASVSAGTSCLSPNPPVSSFYSTLTEVGCDIFTSVFYTSRVEYPE